MAVCGEYSPSAVAFHSHDVSLVATLWCPFRGDIVDHG